MTSLSLSCGVDALLRAAEFLEKQENQETTTQLYRPVVAESLQISTGKKTIRFLFLIVQEHPGISPQKKLFRQKPLQKFSATLKSLTKKKN